MTLQSILILLVSVGLIVAGIMEITRSRRRNRTGRDQDRRGLLLFVIGSVYALIVLITQPGVLGR